MKHRHGGNPRFFALPDYLTQFFTVHLGGLENLWFLYMQMLSYYILLVVALYMIIE